MFTISSKLAQQRTPTVKNGNEEVIEEAAMPRTKMEMLKAMYHEMEQMKAKDLKANYGKIMSAMHPEGAHEDDEDEDMQEMKKLKAAKHEIEEKIKKTLTLL